MDQKKFEFPDEDKAVPETAGDEINIEVVDDTPPEDRGRVPLPKEIVEELEQDDLEEYSEKVKKRLSQMKKVWHDERREKERAAREKEEAIRFAQQALEENKRLKSRLTEGEKVFVAEVTKAATNELAVAKSRLKAAYESGDAGEIADAQEALTDVKLKLKQYENMSPPSLQQEDSAVERNPQPERQYTDRKAESWRERNTWFGTNKSMTALALGLHEELVESGVDPRSDEYYRRIDATMKRRFPDYFEESTADSQREQEKPAPRTKTAPVVAPVTRSTSPRQIKLTPSAVAIAKKLGLSNEAYAREVMKLENDNG